MIDKIDKDGIKVVILAGGRGTRAYPHTDSLPKPMLPVDGKPIIMRVMRIFAEQGFRKFVLSLGYRGDVIVDYFANKSLDWQVEFAHTGEDTDTGGRIARCKDMLGSTFMATYADGLAKVPLDELLRYHRSHGGLVTVTSVPLTSQYGTIDANDSGRILSFNEKPTLRNYWINAGFMVFEHAVFQHWEGKISSVRCCQGCAKKGSPTLSDPMCSSSRWTLTRISSISKPCAGLACSRDCSQALGESAASVEKIYTLVVRSRRAARRLENGH